MAEHRYIVKGPAERVCSVALFLLVAAIITIVFIDDSVVLTLAWMLGTVGAYTLWSLAVYLVARRLSDKAYPRAYTLLVGVVCVAGWVIVIRGDLSPFDDNAKPYAGALWVVCIAGIMLAGSVPAKNRFVESRHP